MLKPSLRSRFRLRALFLSLALIPGLAMPQAAAVLPTLGDSVSDQVGLQEERKYGDWIMSQVRLDPSVLDDPLLQAYIESLWEPLMQAARTQGQISEELMERFAWETLLVRERNINASAWPGGLFRLQPGLAGHDSGPGRVGVGDGT